MGEIINAIILGIIQGLTEFLPVSSSGHLEIGKYLLGDESMPDESMLMTVMLHGATALSTMFVFRKEVMEILKGLINPFKNTQTKKTLRNLDDDNLIDGQISEEVSKSGLNEETLFSLKIILSMIPAVFVGLFFEDLIETLFSRNLLLIGLMLFVTGLLLFLADRAKNTEKEVSFGNALIIGIAQAIAILPGISRSGATISTSVLLGIDRTRAAKFSFLMVVPLIFGKMAKDIMDGALTSPNVDVLPLAAGFVAAFFTGIVACVWMIALVKKSKLSYFAIYCFIVGAIAVAKGMGLF